MSFPKASSTAAFQLKNCYNSFVCSWYSKEPLVICVVAELNVGFKPKTQSKISLDNYFFVAYSISGYLIIHPRRKRIGRSLTLRNTITKLFLLTQPCGNPLRSSSPLCNRRPSVFYSVHSSSPWSVLEPHLADDLLCPGECQPDDPLHQAHLSTWIC